jgi:hypothetical protein
VGIGQKAATHKLAGREKSNEKLIPHGLKNHTESLGEKIRVVF